MRKPNWKRRGLSGPITHEDLKTRKYATQFLEKKKRLPSELRQSMDEQIPDVRKQIELLQSML